VDDERERARDLAALVVLPGLDDPELGYPLLMLEFLPVGVLGLGRVGVLVAQRLSAFTNSRSYQ
jgi:solute:Na+ symporter, SSS family